MRFMLAAALLIAATACDKKVDRPAIPPDTVVDDQCGDSSPGCPRDTTGDTLRVDSAGASYMPKPAVWRLASMWRWKHQVASDTSSYKIHYSLPQPLPATDTVQLRVGRDSAVGWPNQPVLTARRTAQRDSATFKVAKVYGANVKFYACRRVLRAGAQVVPERCQNWRTNWPGRLPDSLWVDSSLALVKLITVATPSLKTETKKQIQFCVFGLYLDNKARMLQNQVNIPECRKAYDGLPITMRLPGYPVAYQRAPAGPNL